MKQVIIISANRFYLSTFDTLLKVVNSQKSNIITGDVTFTQIFFNYLHFG